MPEAQQGFCAGLSLGLFISVVSYLLGYSHGSRNA